MSNGTSIRLMIFVDGSNFLCRLEEQLGEEINTAKPNPIFIDIATTLINGIENQISHSRRGTTFFRIRRYWFGSFVGSEEEHDKQSELFRKYDFEPILFRKIGNKEKGVDIALTREVLINAFNNNYDAALIFAGDADYIELIKDIKRYGNIVYGSFFQSDSLSKYLKQSFDYYFSINQTYPNIKEMFEGAKKTF